MKTLLKKLFGSCKHEYGPEFHKHGMLLRQCKHCNMADIVRDYSIEAGDREIKAAVLRLKATVESCGKKWEDHHWYSTLNHYITDERNIPKI